MRHKFKCPTPRPISKPSRAHECIEVIVAAATVVEVVEVVVGFFPRHIAIE